MLYKQSTELYHHGIKGQKWGIRRYQNEDGTFTEEGRKRYHIQSDGTMSREGKKNFKLDQKYIRGKHEREKGRTITGEHTKNAIVASSLALIGTASLAAAKNEFEKGGNAKKVNALTAAALASYGGALASMIRTGKITSDIRSYYTQGNKSVVELDKPKLPAGTKIDGYIQRNKLPAGTKIDGAEKKKKDSRVLY